MDEFLHINLGNLLTIFSFLIGGTAFAYTIRSDLNIQTMRMNLLHEQNVLRLTTLENEIKILREVVVDQAEQRSELRALADRLGLFERRFDQVLQHLNEKD